MLKAKLADRSALVDVGGLSFRLTSAVSRASSSRFCIFCGGLFNVLCRFGTADEETARVLDSVDLCGDAGTRRVVRVHQGRRGAPSPQKCAYLAVMLKFACVLLAQLTASTNLLEKRVGTCPGLGFFFEFTARSPCRCVMHEMYNVLACRLFMRWPVLFTRQ